MKIGYVGLGKMGKNMVLRLLEQGIQVVAWNRSPEPREEVAKAGAQTVEDLKDLPPLLDTPRIIWLMLPSGEVTDEKLQEIVPLLDKGDLVIDGGNSFYKDSIRRGQELAQKGIHFMDIGTSGGPGGARNGACLMIGGSGEDFERIKELVVAASAPDAFKLLGPIGAGHFVKMIHNGVEYGMMQALAEGVAILKKSDFKLDLVEVMDIYNHQSVITSRLVGWMKDALTKYPELKEISSKIDATGEGEWTIQTAKEVGIEVPVIEKSMEVRSNSSETSNSFRDKAVSALRGEFGQHSVKKQESN